MANRRSKFIPVADRVLNSAGKVVSKVAESTFRYVATDHSGSHISRSIMEMEQSLNYTRASLDLFSRQCTRSNERIGRLFNTGVDDNVFEIAAGWLVDHALYVLDLLWGFISPILMYIAWSLFSIIFIVACNVIFFGGLYWLLIS